MLHLAVYFGLDELDAIEGSRDVMYNIHARGEMADKW
jgi:hypothetical protein